MKAVRGSGEDDVGRFRGATTASFGLGVLLSAFSFSFSSSPYTRLLRFTAPLYSCVSARSHALVHSSPALADSPACTQPAAPTSSSTPIHTP